MAERLDPGPAGQLDDSNLDALTLPVLPLANGVVLPQMVVTLALETDEAKAAGDAAAETARSCSSPASKRPLRPGGDDRPHREPRDPSRRHPGPRRAGDRPCPRRRRRRSARPRPSGSASSPSPRPRPPSGPTELARDVRAAVSAPVRPARRPPAHRGAARRRRSRRAGRPGRLVARPRHRAQGRAARDHRRRGAARQGARVGQGGPGRARADRAHPQRGQRRHGEEPARVPAAPAAGRHPQGAR